MNWMPKSAIPPSGYHYGPAYRPSWGNIIRTIIYIARGERRSLARDALLAMWNMPVPPLVQGHEHVPEKGPLIIVANHYERPGLWMAFPALYIGHLVRERTGEDTSWIAIEEWESFSLWGISIPPRMIRAVFQRAFAVYNILAMAPPTAPAGARARSMRMAAEEIKGGHIIGLMPEGDVGTTPELLPAREGVGSFLLLLVAQGAPVLPVGLYEDQNRLVARFGESFTLLLPPDLPRSDRDRWVRDRTMVAIRNLLPESLWGAYSGTQVADGVTAGE